MQLKDYISNILFIIGFIIFVFLLISCRKNTLNYNSLTYTDAVAELPLYNNFINYLKNEGFEFWDFHKYWIADKNNLPENLIVLRHDVHLRDVAFAYYTYLIEKELIGDNAATYYVMLNHPWCESTDDYQKAHDDYIELINYLKNKNVDIQPHISPADLYVSAEHPYWENFSIEKLTYLVNHNYTFKYYDNGIDIIVTGFDSLNINLINKKMPALLSNYNNQWKKETGLTVESYAAHGSAIALNHALGNTRILNQRFLLKSGLYEFDTFCTLITRQLDIIHDNERPEWIENPELISLGEYELLVHPYVWHDPQAWRDENSASGK